MRDNRVTLSLLCVFLCVVVLVSASCSGTDILPTETDGLSSDLSSDTEAGTELPNPHETDAGLIPNEVELSYRKVTADASEIECISEDEILKVLLETEIAGASVILYVDADETFCTAYRKDGRLFRFIHTGGVEPPNYRVESFSDVLGEDGFTVFWSWTHAFCYYYTVEDGIPVPLVEAYDTVSEVDIDGDGIREVICESMFSVDVFDTVDGETVYIELEPLFNELGRFNRYDSEKNIMVFENRDDDGEITDSYSLYFTDRMTAIIRPGQGTASE